MIKKLAKTKELELIAQTQYVVRSRRFNEDVSIHSHLKTARQHFNKLKEQL
jgi:hypothetical protein